MIGALPSFSLPVVDREATADLVALAAAYQEIGQLAAHYVVAVDAWI